MPVDQRVVASTNMFAAPCCNVFRQNLAARTSGNQSLGNSCFWY